MTIKRFLRDHDITFGQLLDAIRERITPLGANYVPVNAISDAFLDLQVVYVATMDLGNDRYNHYITDEDLKYLGVSHDDLKIIAKENRSNAQYFYAKIEDMIFNMANQSTYITEPKASDKGLWVLSGKAAKFGAACMVDCNFLKKVADKRDDDLILLPSSVHELLCFPAKEVSNRLDSIREMVVDVNNGCVNENEKLSDEIYYFDREKMKVQIITGDFQKEYDEEYSTVENVSR